MIKMMGELERINDEGVRCLGICVWCQNRNKNKVFLSQKHYKKALETAEQIYKNPASGQGRKISMRGVHLRSMYNGLHFLSSTC